MSTPDDPNPHEDWEFLETDEQWGAYADELREQVEEAEHVRRQRKEASQLESPGQRQPAPPSEVPSPSPPYETHGTSASLTPAHTPRNQEKDRAGLLLLMGVGTFFALVLVLCTGVGLFIITEGVPDPKIGRLPDDTTNAADQGPFVVTPEPGLWIDIFDGASTEGWQLDGSATWTVEDGIMVGRGRSGHGRLVYSRETFEDLEVRVECKVNAGGNSGVYVRTQFGSQVDNGYEAQVTNIENQSTWTGGIHKGTVFKRKLVQDDTWFVLTIRAVDNVISVEVNEQQTSQLTDDKRRFRSGMIALQAWGRPTVVSFRRVQIRRLNSVTTQEEG